jgi:hypothetical protein
LEKIAFGRIIICMAHFQDYVKFNLFLIQFYENEKKLRFFEN